MVKNKKAFSLAELILIVLILGVLTVITIPKMQFATLRRQKADATAKKIATSLRLTRRLAITNAAVNVSGYALRMTGASPYSSYEVVNLKTSEVVDSYDIDPDVACTGGNVFRFGPLGKLKLGSANQLSVSSEGKSFSISIVPATGMVKCVGS